MQDQNTYRLEPVPNMIHVVQLSPRDTGALDPQVVQTILDAYEPDQAEALLAEAIDSVTDLTHSIAQSFRASEFELLPAYALGLIKSADDLGLTELSLAAEHLLSCARSDDFMALAAIVSRIKRLCSRAADDLWTVATA